MKHMFLPLALIIAVAPASATVQFEAEKTRSYDEQRAAELEATARSLLGKTFWFEPRPNDDKRLYRRLAFKEVRPGPGVAYSDYFKAPTFRPIGKVAFTVTNVFAFRDTQATYGVPAPRYFTEVTFQGGKVGYLEMPTADSTPFEVYDSERRYLVDSFEVVYTEDPDVMRQRESEAKAAAEHKRVARERAWQARGGVLVGMTKQQVLASNWGAPKRINKSTNSFGTSEQWVYGGGNYLYFTNGVLTNIQH